MWGNEWSRFPRHLGWSDPLVGGGLWSHGVERGTLPAASGVVGSGAPGGQSTQAVFIGDPAASFDRSGDSYDRKSSNPHAGFPEWKKFFS